MSETDVNLENTALELISSEELELLNQEANNLVQVMDEERDQDQIVKIMEQLGNIGEDTQRSAGESIEILKTPIKEIQNRSDGSDIPATLSKLRGCVEELNPAALHKDGVKGFLTKVLRRSPFEKYMRKYESVGKQIDIVIEGLLSGKDQLQSDSVELDMIRKQSIEKIKELQKDIYKGKKLYEVVKSKLKDPQYAQNKSLIEKTMRKIIVRIGNMEQMVNVLHQAIQSIAIIDDNNEKLQEAIFNAITMTKNLVTVSASIQVALSQQSKVIKAVETVNQSMEDLIVSNAKSLKENANMSTKLLEKPSISVEKLKQSFMEIEQAVKITEESNRKVIASRERFVKEMEVLNKNMLKGSTQKKLSS